MLGPIAGSTSFRVLAVAFLMGSVGPGCSFGPKILERTHGKYNDSIRRVDEEQLLRNLVRLRYTESPLDLRVVSIAAQYELTGVAEARPFYLAPNPPNGGFFKTFATVLPDLSLTGTNRPTITLVPDDDGDAVRRFLTPISLDTLVLLTQTNWPASSFLRIWVDRLNGVPNAANASGPYRDEVPDFLRFRRVADLIESAGKRRLLSLHPEVRLAGLGVPHPPGDVTVAAEVEAAKNGLQFHAQGDGTSFVLARKERKLVLEVSSPILGDPELAELTGLLGLREGQPIYDVAIEEGDSLDGPFSLRPPSTELRARLRFTAQVFIYLSNGVEVPAEHVASGIIRPTTDADGRAFDWGAVTRGLFCVHACKGHRPPENAYVAVSYRGYWYYIDDRDQQTKATFALVLQLSRLDFSRQQAGGPLLTLPVGR